MSDITSKLLSQLYEQSIIMADYALGCGKQVPDEIVETLVAAGRFIKPNDESKNAGRNTLTSIDTASEQSGPDTTVAAEMDAQGEALEISSDESSNDSNGSVDTKLKEFTKRLTVVHGQLSQIIAPALPHSLKLLHDEKKKGGWRQKLGPVPLIQGMVIASLISLFGYIACIALDAILSPNANDPFSMTQFFDTFVQLLVLVSAAGMGASYLALYQANRYVIKGTFDPKYNSTYWIRFVLGLISGIILAEVVSQTQEELLVLGKTVLALLGGFSASVVYRILTSLVEAVESIFRGDPTERIEAEEQVSKARAGEQYAQERLDIAAELMSLSQVIGTEDADRKLKNQINNIYAKLAPYSVDLANDSGSNSR